MLLVRADGRAEVHTPTGGTLDYPHRRLAHSGSKGIPAAPAGMPFAALPGAVRRDLPDLAAEPRSGLCAVESRVVARLRSLDRNHSPTMATS
jgi:hypothetical protein